MQSNLRSRLGRSVAVAALCTLALTDPARAATQPTGSNNLSGEFFGLNKLHEFHLIISPEEWAKMENFDVVAPNQPLNGPRGNQPGPRGPNGPGQPGPPMMSIDFQEGHARLEFEGKEWGMVSARFKGNSSFNIARNTLKRSVKLDFNDVEKGKRFFGMTKLNLNNGAMDPSVLREALAYDVFRHAGVPASRTAFAKVFLTVPGKLDHEYAGLYTAVEQVDDEFLKEHFGNKSGLLLKPERVNGLPYLGEEWPTYERQFELKSSVKPKEAKRFIGLARLVNQATDGEFAAQIRSFMDVDAFLRFLAVEGILSNLDSPLLTGHNYYMYLDPATDRWSWIPWDLNEAFGGFMQGATAEDMINLNIRSPFTRGNLLAERVLALEGRAAEYKSIVRGLIATNFTAQRLGGEMESAANLVREAVRADQYLAPMQFERHLSENPAALPPGGGPLNRRGAPPLRQGAPGPQGRGPAAGGPGKPLLRQFVIGRIQSIEDQFAGKREGYQPVMNRPPGRGGPLPGNQRGAPQGPPPTPPPPGN